MSKKPLLRPIRRLSLTRCDQLVGIGELSMSLVMLTH
jgi:hypothetical protein